MIIFSGCATEKAPDFSSKNYKNAEIKSQDESYLYLRDKVLFSDQYSNIFVHTGTIDATDSLGKPINIYAIDNNYNCYHVRDSDNYKPGEIGVYNLKSSSYTKLIDLSIGSQGAINAITDKYLVWTESIENSNWNKTCLHVYNLKEKNDEVFYIPTRDPQTGVVYEWNWSNPVIIDSKIYFDDYTEKSADTKKVDMFCYDIDTKEVTKIEEMAKWPTKYKNQISWNKMGETENECLIYTYDGKEKTLVTTINADSEMTYLNTGGDCIIITNQSTDLFNDKDTGNGLQIYKDGKVTPILATNNSASYINWPITNGYVITFNNSVKQKPIFYDIHNDFIVELDVAKDNLLYTSYLSDDFIMFVSQDENDKLLYHMIKISNLS